MTKISVNRFAGDFGFEAKDEDGHTVLMDANEAAGGSKAGVRPMQMLLMGLGGCSGIDIVAILKKQREPIEDFSMEIEAEREQGKEPSLWQAVKIMFTLKGNIDPSKAERACALSMEKYCSVAATLRKAGTAITWECRVIH